MEPYLWIWLLASPLVFAVISLMGTGKTSHR